MSHTEWEAIFDDLRTTLAEAQTHRDQRRDVTDGLPGWVSYEIETMTDRVNLLRSRRASFPIATERVASVEQMASGHVDYSKKFALYCADLVVDHVARP